MCDLDPKVSNWGFSARHMSGMVYEQCVQLAHLLNPMDIIFNQYSVFYELL